MELSAAILSIAAAPTLGAMSPGPSFVMVARTASLCRGRMARLRCSCAGRPAMRNALADQERQYQVVARAIGFIRSPPPALAQ